MVTQPLTDLLYAPTTIFIFTFMKYVFAYLHYKHQSLGYTARNHGQGIY